MLSTNAQRAATSHRRQNSSPTGMNSAIHPAFVATNHQQAFHRRGLSTGYSAQSQDHGLTNHDEKVSIFNQGQQRQHNMRAAQMPALSRPGQNDGFLFENIAIEPSRAPQWDDSNQFIPIDETAELPENVSQFSATEQADATATIKASSGTSQQPNTATAAILKLMDHIGNLPSQDVKKVLADIGSKYDILEKARPQGQSATPSEVIARKNAQVTDMPESKAFAAPMKRGQSWQEPALAGRIGEDDTKIPTPPHTVPLRCSATFDVASYPSTTFLDISDLKFDLSNGIGGYSSSNYSPTSNRSGLSSFQSSPELAPLNLFGANVVSATEGGMNAQDDIFSSSPPGSPQKQKHLGSRKFASNKNCSDDESAFNPNDFLVPSSVTEEEINAFIQGPDENGKYQCLYENCKNAPFGRKENIRAHVQTHLDDRRYKCDACNNKFVRPNDLKRHWQIHVNKRDFKCFCGAAFNRHDALKRHRERSEWCESSGARGSPDSPKKDEKKRGRPKKIAPTESQERRERKALIRREVQKKQEASAASSVVSSLPSPPAFFDFADYHGTQHEHQMVSPSHTSLTPPASPRDDMDDVFSPYSANSAEAQRNQSLSPPPTRDSMLSFGLAENKSYEGLMFGNLENSLPSEVGISARDSSQHGSPPSLKIGSSSPPRLVDINFSSDRPILGQDMVLSSDVGNDTLMEHDEFDLLAQWLGEETMSEPIMGINPSKMHLSLSMGDSADPLFG